MSEVEVPMTVISLTAPVGSTAFDVHFENADAAQCFAAARLVELFGEEMYAEMRAAQIVKQPSIVVPNRETRRRMS